MDLNEQADQAVDRVFDDAGTERPHADSHGRIIARMIWLDGHKAGSDAVLQIVKDNVQVKT